jgi:ubiquitin-protein ligase
MNENQQDFDDSNRIQYRSSSTRKQLSTSTTQGGDTDLVTKTIPRLTKEYRQLIKNPVDGIIARPAKSNLLNWYFVIDGPDHQCVKDGKYFGRLVFPIDYPFSPPSVFMDTPSHLFSMNEHVCMTNTAYHSESWTPQWSIGSLLTSLRMFFIARFNERVLMMNSRSEQQREEAIVQQYTNSTLYTTYRLLEFRTIFPDIAAQFKYQLQQKAYDHFQTNPTQLPPTIKLPLPRPTPPETPTQQATLSIPTVPQSTIQSETGHRAFSATSSRTETPTTLSALEDFSDAEKIYIKYLLDQLPYHAKHQLWYLEGNWFKVFLFLGLLIIIAFLSLIGFWD